jgi:hypothetical protein
VLSGAWDPPENCCLYMWFTPVQQNGQLLYIKWFVIVCPEENVSEHLPSSVSTYQRKVVVSIDTQGHLQ